MKNYDNDRLIINLANYILENKTTIRATATAFGIPKSTVHNNLSKNLKLINYKLYSKVQNLLDENFNIKHIHGGESTKLKYLKLKQLININDKIEAINN